MVVRILYTNNTLSQAAGTELAVKELCLEMQLRGHAVATFSVQHGGVAAQLREAGVPVAACPAEVPFEPDVIHGHHEWETSLAALQWPHCPVISFCQGLYGWQEEPCLAPNVVRWVAIDEPCRQRLLNTLGVAPDKVHLVLNGIDLKRFQAGPVERPRFDKALILSNYATTNNFAAVVQKGCRLVVLDCQILDLKLPANVHPIPPVSYLEMVALLDFCDVVATDSGGLQKEAYWMQRPCVTLRQETEWSETLEHGWNRIVGADASLIADALAKPVKPSLHPPLYGDGNAAAKVAEALVYRRIS